MFLICKRHTINYFDDETMMFSLDIFFVSGYVC